MAIESCEHVRSPEIQLAGALEPQAEDDKGPHEELTVKQMRKQMEYALEQERYSKVRNIAGDGISA